MLNWKGFGRKRSLHNQDTVPALSEVTKDNHDELKTGWSVSRSIFGPASAEIYSILLTASYCSRNATVGYESSWGGGGVFGGIAALILNLGKVHPVQALRICIGLMAHRGE